MTAHSVLNVRAALEWGNSELYKYYERNGLGYGTVHQYKHESKEDIAGFISKPVARPEYGMIYQHKGMLLQNLHRRYLYIIIKLPHLSEIVTIMALYTLTIQTHYWMIHQQMIMNYTRLSVIMLRLIIFKKWTLLLNYETD